MFNPNIITPVAILVSHCHPSAISWLIVPIYVYAVNRKFRRRTFSNSSKECFKRFIPFRAYSDTSSAVIRIFWIRRIIAPALNQFPDIIGWVRFHAVSSKSRSSFGCTIASATNCSTRPKTSNKRNKLFAAVTSAHPLAFISEAIFYPIKQAYASISVSGTILCFHGDSIPHMRCHCGR